MGIVCWRVYLRVMLYRSANQRRRAGGDVPQYSTGGATDAVALETTRQDTEVVDDLPRYEPRK